MLHWKVNFSIPRVVCSPAAHHHKNFVFGLRMFRGSRKRTCSHRTRHPSEFIVLKTPYHRECISKQSSSKEFSLTYDSRMLHSEAQNFRGSAVSVPTTPRSAAFGVTYDGKTRATEVEVPAFDQQSQILSSDLHRDTGQLRPPCRPNGSHYLNCRPVLPHHTPGLQR